MNTTQTGSTLGATATSMAELNATNPGTTIGGKGGSTLRERVIRFYRLHAPDKMGEVDELLATSRFSEDSLMAALTAKYGRDNTTSEVYKSQPLRSMIVDYEFTSAGDNDQASSAHRALGLKGKDQVIGMSTNVGAKRLAKDGPSSADRGDGLPSLDGGAVLSQLILNHLDANGLGAVAECFRNELSLCGCAPQYFDDDSSPITLKSIATTTTHLAPGRKDDYSLLGSSSKASSRSGNSGNNNTTGQSALVQLLCPAANTREKIALLMHDVKRQITSGLGSVRRDDVSLSFLIELARAPVWMEPMALSKTSYVHHQTGKLRAATLNQLVEHMCRVVFQPHVAVPKDVQDMDDNFVLAMILTHKYFTSSHILLAKLMQRFFVPVTLPLGDRFDRHGITIVNTNSANSSIGVESTSGDEYSKRSKYHLEITKLVQIKVLTVVATWLRETPHHFDTVMVDAIRTWVEETCYVPAIWADTPTELMQGAEIIKLHLKEIEEQLRRSDGDNLGKSSAQQRTNGNIKASERANNISFLFAKHKTNTRYELKGGADSIASVVTGTSTSHHADPNTSTASGGGGGGLHPQQSIATATNSSMEALSKRIDQFLDVDELRLANQITTVDHSLFRQIDPSELFIFATQNGVMRLHMTNHPALHLNVFLHRAEDIMYWVVSEILICAKHAIDEHRFAMTRGGGNTTPGSGPGSTPSLHRAQKVVSKFISLAFRMLEMNNLHSSFAVLCGLRHPCVARLRTSLWAGLSPATQTGFEELSELFDFSKGYKRYKEYVSAIPDSDVYPVLPLVSVWIDELRRLETSQPTVLRDLHNRAVVHWRKFDVLFTISQMLRKHQNAKVPAEFEEIPECTEWVADRLVSGLHDTDKLLSISLAIENGEPNGGN